jgi:hypothetical protein
MYAVAWRESSVGTDIASNQKTPHMGLCFLRRRGQECPRKNGLAQMRIGMTI